jgi:uncharacterized protein YbaR (Trm112 family)
MSEKDAPETALGRVLAMIACPACHGSLRNGPQRLECGQCGRAYPVVDGIPVLIVPETEP